MENSILKQFHVTVTLPGDKKEFDTRAYTLERCIEEVQEAYALFNPLKIEAKPLQFAG